jgi:superfamily II DNA or RNA helicase
MTAAKPALIDCPEQIRLDIKTSVGHIRQLRRAASQTDSPLINFTIGKISGQLYTRPSGERVLLVENKVSPPEKVDEVLWLQAGHAPQWLKPLPISQMNAIPNRSSLAKAVRDSWKDQFFYVEEEQHADFVPGLRPPQIGALYAALAHWKVTDEPANIVMPTGTGKTETMLAVLAKERLSKLLVVVPTDALRDQLARKFQTFGVLRPFGVIGPKAEFPVVGLLKKIPTTVSSIQEMFELCNVVVTTMAVAGRARDFIQAALADCATHLFIDEAHHIKAPTWYALKAHFQGKPILQFTATPFRNDGKLVDGRAVFTYPLRKAQAEGYFKPITFTPVVEFFPTLADEKIAARAVAQLRCDLASGFDHLIMARAEEIKRAKDIVPIYRTIAPEFNPLLLHSELTRTERMEAFEAIRTRKSRILVCVDMLGEGFDLPQLKIAAIHDIHKSLAVTLQFIGRFTRTLGGVGNATAIANIASPEVEGGLRALYAEDSDWNQLLQVLADSSTQREAKRAEFLAQFVTDNPVIPLQNIMPKMSTVIYRTDCLDWQILPLQRLAEKMGMYGSLAVNQSAKVALFVVRNVEGVEWGEVRELANTIWHLYVFYWDSARNVLFINTSDTDSSLDKLAEAVAGKSAKLIRGEEVFRTFSGLNRLMLMNLGLNHSLSRAVRFTMFVGADIQDGLSQAQQQGKIKSNTFGRGFELGEKTTVGCSHRGRIWSYKIASDVSQWVEWCDSVGTKVLDPSISFDKTVLPYLLIPQEILSRPARVPLAVEWSDALLRRNETYVTIDIAGRSVPFFDVGLDVGSHSETGPLTFRVFTEHNSYEYEAVFHGDKVDYRPRQTDLQINLGKKRSLLLSDFFQSEPPVFYFDSGGFLIYNRYCELTLANRQPYDAARIEAWDWTGIDIQVESQTEQKIETSIQYRLIQTLLSPAWQPAYDFILDDDSANEAADVVGIAVSGDEILIHLFHCKFSSEPEPGSRVKDLYEVCGQAQRSARWRHDVEKLLGNLLRRNAARIIAGGVSRFEKGTKEMLISLKNRSRLLKPRLSIFVVQPGLAKSQAKANQLELLATTELHVRDTSLAELRVIASP